MRNYLITRNNRMFDTAFDNLFKPVFFNLDTTCTGMKTDIKELDDRYEMVVEMAGFDKNDINVEIEDGYINVSANKAVKEENDKDGRFLRRERAISCNRSYYFGEVDKDGVKAKYENGILNITVPKTDGKKESSNKILIE